MTTAILSHTNILKRAKNNMRLAALPKINWKILCFGALFACLALLFYYVWQIRYLTNGSYFVERYEKEISQISEEKKNLEVSFAEAGFLGQVEQRIRELNFQKATSVKYIQVPDGALAKAK